MRILPLVARTVAVQMILASGVPSAFADTNNAVETTVEADSYTDTAVLQESGSGSIQEAGINGEAGLFIESNQLLDTDFETDIHQECVTGTGNQLCFNDASPQITNTAIQTIDATTQNDMAIGQHAGSGAIQIASATGTALTDIVASQTVTPTVIIDIFQDCDMQIGVCVQRALPEVLTLASQAIAASALNNLGITQEAGSGSSQDAIADLVAQVNVSAEQIVSPRTFLSLTQLCAIDLGMCIQRAMPIIQTAVEQVIDASAYNTTDIVQDGASAQSATVKTDAETNVTSHQAVDAQSTITMLQKCGVGKGLCLQVDAYGNPTYIFTDGVTTSSGDYVGVLNEAPLDSEYSRGTVAIVAGGICGGAGTCTMLEQLLLWLFGPEPITESVIANRDRRTEGSNSAHRGHDTNMLGGSVRFLAQYMSGDEFAPAAFGGLEGGAANITSAQKELICSLRTRLLQDSRSGAIWSWTARHIAQETGMDADITDRWLHNPLVCPEQKVAAVRDITMNFFPIADDGPVSSNSVWNKCIRGENMSVEEIRANTDRTEDNLPRTCASYHTQSSWYHPDLHVFFTWDSATGYLQLPDGYMPQVQGM